MKVVIGDTLYDANEVPILLILTDDDKNDIENLSSDQDKFCVYPDSNYSYEEILEWISKYDL